MGRRENVFIWMSQCRGDGGNAEVSGHDVDPNGKCGGGVLAAGSCIRGFFGGGRMNKGHRLCRISLKAQRVNN